MYNYGHERGTHEQRSRDGMLIDCALMHAEPTRLYTYYEDVLLIFLGKFSKRIESHRNSVVLSFHVIKHLVSLLLSL